MREILRPGRRELFGLKLSVVIPTLNAASTLAACLERVQGVPEILVVVGGSDDITRDVAKALGARIIAAPRGRGQR